MTEIEELRQQVARATRHLRLATAGLILLAGGGLVAAAHPGPDVLRVRGLVVVDSLGRERVLIGAPLSGASANPRLGSAEGLVIMDSAGHMLTAVGYNNPLVLSGDRTGKRIGAATGLTFYDPRTGAERGGMGAFGDGRANACLDYAGKDKEAVRLSVAPADAYAAVLINGTPRERAYDRVVMYAGQDGSGTIKVFGGGPSEGGVMLEAGRGTPKVVLVDSSGKRTVGLPRE